MENKYNRYPLNKKLFLFLFGFLYFLNGFAQDFVVNKSTVDIYLSEKGYFDVVETYDLTFTAYKHGIYRNIQVNYNLQTSNGKNEKRRIKIRKVDVPNHEFSVAPNFIQKISDNLEIKIGDKDVTVIGPQHYEIQYRVYNAFLFEDSQIQFYWNIKPPGWLANFQQLEFSVHLPKNMDLGINHFKVYSGETGVKTPSTEFNVNYNDGVFTAQSRDNFTSKPGENVTVVVSLPKGSIAEIKPFWPFWTHYGWTLIIAALLFVFYWIWNKYGKDDRVVATTSYFPPSGIDPAMAGFLIDDSENTKDLISFIPYWGSRGIIKMEQIPKEGWFGSEDTKLTRLRPLPVDSPKYEEEIFNGLFGSYYETGEKEVLISSLRNTFYTTMANAKEELKKKAQIYYDPLAKKVKKRTMIWLLIAAFLLTVIFLFTWGIWAVLAFIPVSIFLLIMTIYLVKKNSKGNKIYSELKGFRQFIKVAEENKLKMLLQDSPAYFETTMGYALAFGMFDDWARKFDNLNLQPPSWYASAAGAYTMHNFANSFSSSITAAQSTMVSSPSSSGGGSSGGGFGGGGGGSW